MIKLSRFRDIYTIVLSVVLSFALVALVTYSASTISTNITTDGDLTITGASTFNGNTTLGNAATDVNLFTGTLQASTTALFTEGIKAYGVISASSTSANLLINGFATTTASSGNFATQGSLYASSTLAVTGVSSFYGNLNFNGFGTTTATNGNFDVQGRISSATTTPAQELSVTGDAIFGSGATTTLILTSTAASTGGCLQLKGADGVLYRVYATGTGPLITSVGNCQ